MLHRKVHKLHIKSNAQEGIECYLSVGSSSVWSASVEQRRDTSGTVTFHLRLWEREQQTDLHGDPAVSCSDVASRVRDVAAHLVVGEVRLLNHSRRIHRHLREAVETA